jgi:hypothetical protein
VDDLLSVADQYHAVEAIHRCEDWLMLVDIRFMGDTEDRGIVATKNLLRMLATADRYNMPLLRLRTTLFFT